MNVLLVNQSALGTCQEGARIASCHALQTESQAEYLTSSEFKTRSSCKQKNAIQELPLPRGCRFKVPANRLGASCVGIDRRRIGV